jgi:hypothetical protein
VDRDTGKPTFSIEPDPFGVGFRVTVAWADGTIEHVNGFSSVDQVRRWIENDAPGWVTNLTKQREAQRRASFKVAANAAAAVSQRETAIGHIFEWQQLEAIDKWIVSQSDPALDRSEAIRRLVDRGLKAK